jgi:hypothetical protein
MKRKPVVAGSFYPGDAVILNRELDNFFSSAKITETYKDILGIIAPHAGYMYSGGCAAFAYKAISCYDFETAVIIAPSHRYGHFSFSVGNFESYLTPLGELQVNKSLVEMLLSKEDFIFAEAAHYCEHSLEIQLPFLQKIKKNIKIVPVLFGNQNLENSQILCNALWELYNESAEKLIFIISTDLSHYHQAWQAEEMDSEFLRFFENGNSSLLAKSISRGETEACGFGGVLSMLELAQKTTYDKRAVLQYTHSGKITGDSSQVVGYASAIIYR